MGGSDKLVSRFLKVPKDLTWDELVAILEHYGYSPLKSGRTGGSRRKFINTEKHVISLHKPHPGNIVKTYVIAQIITVLKEKGRVS